MSRRVLLIAHDFPPMQGGGIARPLAFAKYLPQFGYDPIVLTRGAVLDRGNDGGPLASLPPSVAVERTSPDREWVERVEQRLPWASAVERSLGKPQAWLATALAWRLSELLPGIAMSTTWIRPGIELGEGIIRRHRPDAIIATGPPFGSMKIGYALARRFSLPFIADYRDPWTYGYLWNPKPGWNARRERAWERRLVEQAARILVVTPSMGTRMKTDYPAAAEKVQILTNGFDGEPAAGTDTRDAVGERLVISHVGTMVGVREPTPIMEALQILQAHRPEVAAQICIRFVGPSVPVAGEAAAQKGVSSMVEDVGTVKASEARGFIDRSDVVLVFEPTGLFAIPGKCYEYLAAKKPILGLTHPNSDLAWLLEQVNCPWVFSPASPESIAEAFVQVWTAWKAGQLHGSVNDAWLARFHRRSLTERLAQILDTVIADSPARANEGHVRA